MTDPTHPADGNPTNLRHCTHPDCERRYYARGLCFLHYQRLREGRLREGRPLDGRRPRPDRPRLPAKFKVPRP